jgi:hypothetical protein
MIDLFPDILVGFCAIAFVAVTIIVLRLNLVI